MSRNMISIQITDDQLAAALNAAAQIEAALPGLISLEPGERRGLLHMGQKTEVFGRGTIRALVQNLENKGQSTFLREKEKEKGLEKIFA